MEDPKRYLKKHHVQVYIEDALKQWLHKKSHPSKLHPLQFLLQYFKDVHTGTHIIGRDYSFVSLTPHNRASFIKLLWRTFFNLSKENVTMKAVDYHQLLQLLCADLPPTLLEVVQVIHSGENDSGKLSFEDVLYTFQVIFYFETFLCNCGSIYHNLLMGMEPEGFKTRVMEVVVVPHSQEDVTEGSSTIQQHRSPAAVSGQAPSLATLSSYISSSSTVTTTSFTLAVKKLCLRMIGKEPWLSCPSIDVLQQHLANDTTHISLKEFIEKLINSEAINSIIGVLPKRTHFLTSPSKLH